MRAIKSVLKFAAKTTLVGLSRVIFMVVFGFVLNLILFFYLPDLCHSNNSSLTGWAYISEVLRTCSVSFVLGLIFIIAFPIGYTFLGYKMGLQSTIHYAYVKNKETFFKYTAHKLVATIDSSKKGTAGVESAVKSASNFFDKMNGVPFVFKGVLKFLKKYIPFVEIVEKMDLDHSFDKGTEGKVAEKLFLEADRYVQEELLEPGWTFPAILLGINLFFFGLIHLVYSLF